MAAVEVREVTGKKSLKQYIHLPARLHKGHSTWLPPIYQDEWSFYDRRKNKAFTYCNTILALAYRNNKPVGRIMGIVNHRYNKIHGENYARFEFMDCIDNREVSHALLAFIEDWARQKGVEKLVGPLGFSDKEPQGFLIDGFEYTAILDAPSNHPYMVELIEAEGYEKFTDLGDYLIKVPSEVPPLYARVLNKVKNKNDLKFIEFKNRKQLKPS